ncbi:MULTISPECIES: shikimate dehydrogenase [Gordonia]|uniref:Shikimate dehydrogenase n=1 Tax=Gordonia amicalis TaxID=89053 RepID=A0ABU4D8M7_9ACTN|nr:MULTISPECIES: shikimate dehydrogenase [Gordonia]MBA5848497.1 shikimate dehydrogenase [Gordonia amicalis]MDV6306087.1 shikimate dehydrogenase [Gordonia amicalis]MDV7098642.1 shikimate dehydrogenase [Gordonia amicalis]NKX78277.1 shikimate dehydrogenase [Gordonia amicalis]
MPVIRSPYGDNRRAAVLGSPIGHSRSPAVHLAAYHALGLDGWSYDRIECTADELPGIVSGAAPEFIGFSVTMPNKLAALDFATERTERAALVGSANTLVRTDDGWRADCTDIDGMTGALAALGVDADIAAGAAPDAVVVGAGGTALPTVVALAEVGVSTISIVARDAGRAAAVLDLCDRLGIAGEVIAFEAGVALEHRCRDASVVVSTVPAPAAEILAPAVAHAGKVVDVIYDPWPTPLAQAVEAAGGAVVGGLVMLLNQAFRQVELFTGLPAPREAMTKVLIPNA